jgi:hypothetical protein
VKVLDLVGPVLCGLGALSMFGALFVDLDSSEAKAFIAVAAALFVPGALLTLATVRRRLGPPR